MSKWIIFPVILVFWLISSVAWAVEEVFDSDGVKIHYVMAGQGEPVILLHGWMGDRGMWGRLDTNPMSKEFLLIAVDLRGHGKSDKPHEVEKYGPAMAEDIIRLIDHLNLPKVHLVGYSMGAIVAGKVAASHPDRVLSIIYGGQAPVLTGANKTDAREIEVFAKAVEEDKDLGAYLMEFFPAGKTRLTAEQARALAKIAYSNKDVKAFAAAGRGIKNLDVTTDQLQKCSAPFLFIHGSKEVDATKQRAQHIVQTLGRGKIRVIDGADHITTLAHPEFGQTVREFLRANQHK